MLHGNRVVLCHGRIGGRLVTSSYSHLDRVRDDLHPGTHVVGGELIGWAGNSGTSRAYGASTRSHLHFEVQIDGRPLGHGLSPTEAGALYEALFTEETP